jgi:outer membrane protein
MQHSRYIELIHLKNQMYRFIQVISFLIVFSIPIISFSQEQAFNLQSLMNLALEKNANVVAQSLSNRISQKQHWQAIAGWLPQISGEGGYIESSGSNGIPDFVAANGLKERIAYLNASQTIFDADNWFRLKESKLNNQQQNVFYTLTRQQVLFEVIQSYFDILKSQGEIKTYQQNLEAFQLIYQQSQLLYKNGEVPEIDVKKSLVEFMLQKNSVIRANKTNQDNINNLKMILNLPMEENIIIEEFPYHKIHLDSLDQYQQVAMNNNLELKILKMDLTRFQIQKTSALLQHLPTANVGFLYGWDTNDLLRGNSSGWQAYFNLSIPLWQWGGLVVNHQIAELQYRQTQTQMEQLQKQIYQQVQIAYNECVIQRQQMEAMEQSKNAAQEAMKMARIGYQEGTLTNLDLINTQKLLTETQINYTNALYDFYIAKAQLFLVIGKMKENFEWVEN